MIGRAVVAGLHDGGYTVDWVRDGGEAELAISNGVYDLALLDLGLPRRDGLEILKSLRRLGKELPVVIITARDSVADRVMGLDNGADDYLVKPFDLDELLARARAVIRRREGRSSPEMTYGALTIDPVKRVCGAGSADEGAGRGGLAREARGRRLRLGRGNRQQQHRSAPAPPAKEAQAGADPQRARRRLPAYAVAVKYLQ